MNWKFLTRNRKETVEEWAVEVLNHALSSEEGKEKCAKFVDILGLKDLPTLHKKTPKIKRGRECRPMIMKG